MKSLRAILLVLALLGFATFNCSYIGLAKIKSADALTQYDLSKQNVAQTSIDDASKRIHFLDQSWTPIRRLGLSTTALSMIAFGLTFRRQDNKAMPDQSLQPTPARSAGSGR
jgi:hypothetical protein